jgi:Co/Zn/Cd efflux system component
VQDQLISKGNKISSQLEQELEHRFGINHPTIQLESSVCGDQGVVVDMHPSLLK